MAASPIGILVSADAGYGAWLGVMLASLLRFDHGAKLHIHLMSDGIDRPTLDTIAAMVEAAGAQLTIYDVAPLLDGRKGTLPVHDYISRATYTKVFFDAIVPPTVERVIYLDVDLVCRGSLRDLWAVDLGGGVAAVAVDCAIGRDAVGDLAAAARKARDRHAERLGLPQDGTYFNTGLIVIDVVQWREQGIAIASAQWTKNNESLVQIAEQDSLNAVLRGRVAWLDDRWNWLAVWAWREPPEDVAICHFAGPDKPWYADYAGPGAADWLAAKAASPFRDVPLVTRSGRTPRTLLPEAGDGALRIRVRPTAAGHIEMIDGIEVIGNDPDCVDVFVFGPHVALPPGSYTALLRLVELADIPALYPGTYKNARFQICVLSGTKSIALLDIEVSPGMNVCDMPVAVGFVLPGPVHDLECWLTASPGVRAKLRADVVLTRRSDTWRSAITV
jgi:lipopolysaccharide biosynthesis glycosyltransferase